MLVGLAALRLGLLPRPGQLRLALGLGLAPDPLGLLLRLPAQRVALGLASACLAAIACSIACRCSSISCSARRRQAP